MKATGWSLGGLALGGALGSFFPPLYLLLPAGTWLAAYLHYRHARLHPGYDEFKRLENTRFAVTADQPAASMPTNPKLLPPSEEEL